MQLSFVLIKGTNPAALGVVTERQQRLHVGDRLSQGAIHVRWFGDTQRLHGNVEPVRGVGQLLIVPGLRRRQIFVGIGCQLVLDVSGKYHIYGRQHRLRV